MALNPFPSKPLTDIFTPQDNTIDRRGKCRTVPMSVLVLGVGRTGTTTLRAALKRLGFEDTYHMMSASVENPLDCLMWQQAFAAKYDGVGKFGREEWDQLLGHCQAVCDWPAIAFSEELIAAYPDAKVILPSRDIDSWYESVLATVWWRVTDPELRWASYVDWAASMYYPMLKKFFDVFFDGDFPRRGKDKYREHYDMIRGLVPKERLLEYSVKEGWGPLCEFLERPKPLQDFPRVNDSSAFVSRCRSRNRRQIANGLFRYLVLALFAWLVVSMALSFWRNW